MADVIGRTLGNYKITELIARGGMAAVYKAYQVSLDRYVALKILPESFAYDPTLFERFEQEAKSAARLRHPSITQVIDFGREGDLVYLVMEYVSGGTLQQRLKQPMALEDALSITRQVAAALSYAHEHGLVHRDVKPSNILFTAEGNAVLSDFGIAKVAERSVALTKTGMGVGTPEYMAPEQAQGLAVDGRTDIYALGVVLYEMTTGRVPYESDTPLGVVLKHLGDPLPLPRATNPAIPEAVEKIILTCMAKSPDNRYHNATELIKALDASLAVSQTLTSMELVDGQATLIGPAAPRLTPPAARPAARAAAKPDPQQDQPTPVPVGRLEPVRAAPAQDPASIGAGALPAFSRAHPSLLPGKSGIVVLAGAVLAVAVLLALLAVAVSALRGSTSASTTPTAVRTLAAAVVVPTLTPTVVPATPTAAAPPTATPAATATTPATAQTPAQSTPAGTPGPSAAANLRGRIVFTTFRGPDKFGDIDIMIQDVPAGSPRLLAQFASDPVLSPDGKRILYYSWTEIGFYTMDLNGKSQVNVSSSSDDAYPSWSPDGKRIAFVNKDAIWTMGADGSGRTKIIDGADQPGWSPDSKQLVYKGCVPPRCGLVIADAAGKNPRLLTADPTDTSPAWDPNGELVLFTSHRSGHMGIWIVRTDGSVAQELTAGHTTASGANYGAATWSVDGKAIIFRSDRDGAWSIWVMNRDGSDSRKVAAANVTDESWRERVSALQ